MGLFGPSQNDVWSQVARDIGAEHTESGFFQKGSLRYRHGNLEIFLDTFTETHHTSSDSGTTQSTYTRMRSPFVSQNDFSFKIYRVGLLSGIGKLFGAQDVEIGDSFFDGEFIIKSNQPEVVKRLLRSDEIKRLIQQQPSVYLETKDAGGFWRNELPEGTRELYFQCGGVMRDETLLKALFNLFARMLDELVELEIATAAAPNVRLK